MEDDMNRHNRAYDLVIVGGSAGGLSVAVSSLRSGLGLIRIIDSGSAVVFPELVGENQLDVGFGESVSSIDVAGDDLVVNTNRLSYRARAVLVADRSTVQGWQPPLELPASPRIHTDEVPAGTDTDVLVIGYTDRAVELAAGSAHAGHRVVLAAGGMDPTRLSPAADNMLRRLERERRLTVLYRSVPDQIGLVNEFPMAYFDDRRTPDLQFDHVVVASERQTSNPAKVGASPAAVATGRLFFLGYPTEDGTTEANTAPGRSIGDLIARSVFPDLELPEPASPVARRRRHVGAIDELRAEHYNATITSFEPTHSDLWVLRVKPDNGDTSYLPGQYASLGLGYWEERIDDAVDVGLEEKWDKLIRRSYSISSRMLEESGYLTDESGLDELEFYIVLVKPTEDNVPGLTPRLALKRPGDRIYLGPKVAGRYTLDAVNDPSCTVVFLSTGTGEAPHNAMIIELLRKGHTGPIVSAVSVRQWVDLGYAEKHRELEARYPNYHYLPLPTREADVPKRYIQDLFRDGVFETDLDLALDAETTHVFLCGNPAMIGLPEGEGETFPETVGVVQLLAEAGFTLDRRKQAGNIHYEEYW